MTPRRKRPTAPRTFLITTITSPFCADTFSLEFTQALQESWSRHPGLRVRLDWSSEFNDDSMTEPSLMNLDVDLCTLARTRILPAGRHEELSACDVSVHLEDGDGFSKIRLHGKLERHPSSEWGSAVQETVHSMVEALCNDEFPPARVPLHAAQPLCTLDALLGSGAIDSDYSLELEFIDDYWDKRELDVERLCAAIEAGQTDDRDRDRRGWHVVRLNAGGTRVVRPLFIEVTRVKLAHLEQPLWRGECYWLTVELDKHSRVTGASICTDSERWANASSHQIADTQFGHRISEECYEPIQWLLDTFEKRPASELEDEG